MSSELHTKLSKAPLCFHLNGIWFVMYAFFLFLSGNNGWQKKMCVQAFGWGEFTKPPRPDYALVMCKLKWCGGVKAVYVARGVLASCRAPCCAGFCRIFSRGLEKKGNFQGFSYGCGS